LDAALVTLPEELLLAAPLFEFEELLAVLVASPDDETSFPEVPLELDEFPSVMELDVSVSFTEIGSDEDSSQLAQKNPVRAIAIFFQCL
jgi:hypothetical protein